MARKWFSAGNSQNQQSTDPVKPPPPIITNADAKKFGLENFGNTCYANSVIQALYFCAPFRDLLVQSSDTSVAEIVEHLLQLTPSSSSGPRKPERKGSTSGPSGPTTSTVASSSTPSSIGISIPATPPSLFSALRSLFVHISSNPADKGTVAPRAFIDKLKLENELFRSNMHQDAHEFFNYLLNKIVEEIEADRKQQNSSTSTEDLSNSIATLASKGAPTTISVNSGTLPEVATLVHKLFEGTLTSETKCLTCETVSSRDESFLDLSIDIEQNSSVTACLRQFSASEMLSNKNKFFCDSCCDLQEAERRMKIKKLPNVLALHLKRFKYQEDLNKYIKLAYRVAFPFQLRLFNTVDDAEDADRLYSLFAIVVHIGSGPHHGHYISIIKTLGTWLVFDDDTVTPIQEHEIPKYYGENSAGSAYVLYYEATDIDPPSLGIRPSDLPIPATSIDPIVSSLSSPTPVIPPGLTEEGDSSDLSDPPYPITPSQSYSPLLSPVDNTASSKIDELGSIPPATFPPAQSPPPARKSFFNSIRRTSTTRPKTAGAAEETDRSGAQLLTDLVPSLHARDGLDEASTIDYSHGHDDDESSVSTSPPPPPPKEKEKVKKETTEKEKEPHRKSSGWFKRRSYRAERSTTSQGSVPSTSSNKHDDFATQSSSTTSSNRPSSLWSKSSTKEKPRKSSVPELPNGGLLSSHTTSGLTLKPQRRTSQHDHSDTPPSATSSIGSMQFVSHTPSSSHTHLRTLDIPPRISSLVPPPFDSSRNPSPPLPQSPSVKPFRSPDHKLSFPHLPGRKSRKSSTDLHRPSTAPGATETSLPSLNPPPPPVPPIPPNMILNNEIANGDIPHHHDKEPPIIPRPNTADPHILSPGLHSFAGQNNSSGSSTGNGATANFKRATRKLSLSSPKLGGFGFGKKDKDKKDKPPSSFTPGFTIA